MRSVATAVLLIAVLLLAGCRADGTVRLQVEHNGSGHVEVDVILDKEASDLVAASGEPLHFGDLRKAGWKVDGPESSPHDGTEYIACHNFESIDEAKRLLEQLSGDAGPLKDVKLSQSRTLFSSSTKFSATGDMTTGVNVFGDRFLSEHFGNPLGFEPKAVQQASGVQFSDAVSMKVELKLPGTTRKVAPGLTEGAWVLPFGSKVSLASEATGARPVPALFFAAGMILLLMAAAFWRAKRREYKPRHTGTTAGVSARDLAKRLRENSLATTAADESDE